MASCIAASARRDGPSGFSFEASLTISVDRQAEVASRFLNWLARFVEREIPQVRLGLIPNGVHAMDSNEVYAVEQPRPPSARRRPEIKLFTRRLLSNRSPA